MPLAAGLYYFHHKCDIANKPPVILIHGAGGSHLSWPPEIRRLSGLNVLTPDLPGHGKSSGRGRQSIEDYAQSIVDFMDAAGVWHATLVGHSMGGAVALKVSVRLPERILGLGLVSCGPRLPVSAKLLENAANPTTFPFAAQSYNTLLCNPQISPKLAAQSLKHILALRQTLLHGDLLACDNFNGATILEGIKLPVLVTCGKEDKLVPPRFSSVLAASIPGAALQVVDGAGHLVQLEQPQRLAKILSVFLQAIPFTPGS